MRNLSDGNSQIFNLKVDLSTKKAIAGIFVCAPFCPERSVFKSIESGEEIEIEIPEEVRVPGLIVDAELRIKIDDK